MDAIDYRTISATVRPPRVVALINRDVVLEDNLAAAELVELAVESKTDEGGGANERAAISKYMELANAIGTTQCVFATSRPQWSAETVHNVEQQFSGTKTRPVYLSHRELYGS